MREVPLNDLVVLIPKSRDESLTAQRLAKMVDVSEPFIRKKINEARAMGIPICSSKRGYYLSDEYGDIAKTIRSLTNRINTQLTAINGLTNRIAKLEKGEKYEQR